MKKMLIALSIVLVLSVSAVFAAETSSPNFPSASGELLQITQPVRNIWATSVIVFQILGFAAILFAGVRYMFAAAEEKADLKKGLSILLLGAVLVFSTATIVGFVKGSIDNII